MRSSLSPYWSHLNRCTFGCGSVGGSPPYNPDSGTPTNTNEPYLSFLDFILAQDSVPQTLTTSYGDDEQTVPPDYAQSVCDGFAKLGARGSSVLFSSGDFAVGAGSCLTNDGQNKVQFLPIFPASCTCLSPRISGFYLSHQTQALM